MYGPALSSASYDNVWMFASEEAPYSGVKFTHQLVLVLSDILSPSQGNTPRKVSQLRTPELFAPSASFFQLRHVATPITPSGAVAHRDIVLGQPIGYRRDAIFKPFVPKL